MSTSRVYAGNMSQGVLRGHIGKYIEWVEFCRFWNKGMIQLQVYIDCDNQLTTNLIRILFSSFNYVAIGMLSQINYLHPSPYSMEYKDMKSTN